MYCERNVRLNNGYEMPLIGLGTWLITGYENVKLALTNAIDLGYRHIDTAYKYLNEDEIGAVLKEMFESGKIKREEIFITTKLHQVYHHNPEEGLKRSLEALGVDYIDLYLIHWPVSFSLHPNEDFKLNEDFDEEFHELDEYDPIKLWRCMEDFVKSKKVRSIGFSNHGINNTEKILSNCTIKPQVVQFEFHPYFQQPKLVEYFRKNDIAIMAHSCLAGGFNSKSGPKILEDPLILEMAKKYNKLPTQVVLSFTMQNGIGIVPKAIEREWQQSNIDLFEFEKEDFDKMKNIKTNFRYSDHPTYGPGRFY